MGVAPLRSTSILPNVTLPLYSPASSSTMGAIARQGPHQAAQKSTSTGLSDFSTSESKFASVTSTVAWPDDGTFGAPPVSVVLPAIHPPDPEKFVSSPRWTRWPPQDETSILALLIGCSDRKSTRLNSSHLG